MFAFTNEYGIINVDKGTMLSEALSKCNKWNAVKQLSCSSIQKQKYCLVKVPVWFKTSSGKDCKDKGSFFVKHGIFLDWFVVNLSEFHATVFTNRYGAC